MEKEQDFLEGVVEDIIYKNDENGYTVARVELDDGGAITIVGALWEMLSIQASLVAVFLITIPITFFFTKWITKRVRPLFRRRSAKLGQLNGFVEEMLNGQKTVRAYGRENAVLEQFDRKNDAAVDAYTKAEANGTVTGPSVNFINNVSLVLICSFGLFLFLKGEVRLGDLSSFVQYSRRFSGPINEIANIIADLQSALAIQQNLLFSFHLLFLM